MIHVNKETEKFMKQNLFEYISTGGGCTAFERKNKEYSRYIWITKDDEAPNSINEKVDISFYHEDGSSGPYIGRLFLSIKDFLALNIINLFLYEGIIPDTLITLEKEEYN